LAYWPMDDIEGTRVRDASPRANSAVHEGGVALYLDGHEPSGRARHFAGGRMHADLPLTGTRYAVEFWFWNGMPTNVRAVTGHLFARGEGDCLALDGEGRLVFENGTHVLRGQNPLAMRTWYRVKLVRRGNTATVFLNGEPLLRDEAGAVPPSRRLWFGGRDTPEMSFEGKLDNIVVWR